MRKEEYKRHWEYAPETQFLFKVNRPLFTKNYLVLLQSKRNLFQYSFCELGIDGKFVHNWSYYTNYRVTVLPENNALYCFDTKKIPFVRFNWRSFEDEERPEKDSLVVYKVLLDCDNYHISNNNIYNLGYYRKGWFNKEYFSPSIDLDVLHNETKHDYYMYHDKRYSCILDSPSKYYHVKFKVIYKWMYFSELLDVIGNPKEFKLKLK